MAMTRQLWSLNGLATELGKDRRTLGRPLRHVPADGTTRGGYQGWFMETALHVLRDKEHANTEDPPTPPGFEVIDRVENPVDKAQLVTLMCLIYRIGPLAASMAVLAGAQMKAAYAVHDLMIMALALEAEEICAAWGIGRFAFAEEPGIFNFDVFDKANWERLAELAGEPVDIQAWQTWARERGTSPADASS
jgi:hypothetical protein